MIRSLHRRKLNAARIARHRSRRKNGKAIFSVEVSRDEITRVLRMRGLPVKHSSTPSFAAAEKIGLRAIVWMMRPNVFAFADGLRVRAPLGLRIALSRRKQGFEFPRERQCSPSLSRAPARATKALAYFLSTIQLKKFSASSKPGVDGHVVGGHAVSAVMVCTEQGLL